ALDVGELADSELRTFAPVTRVFDTAERHARVGTDVLVDEAEPRLELVGSDSPAAIEVAGEHARTEAELAGVGNANGIALVLGRDERRDRTEPLFIVRGLARQQVGEDGRRVPGAGPVGNLAAEQQPRALAHALAHLAVDFVPRPDALHRTEPGPVA